MMGKITLNKGSDKKPRGESQLLKGSPLKDKLQGTPVKKKSMPLKEKVNRSLTPTIIEQSAPENSFSILAKPVEISPA